MKNAQRAANQMLMARHNVRSMSIMTDRSRVTSVIKSNQPMSANSVLLNQTGAR